MKALQLSTTWAARASNPDRVIQVGLNTKELQYVILWSENHTENPLSEKPNLSPTEISFFKQHGYDMVERMTKVAKQIDNASLLHGLEKLKQTSAYLGSGMKPISISKNILLGE
ncbi:hypothetical protein B9Z55_025183 [Caenorhabditis nigoni]|uniref:Uncharacterized protein n=1 Tax=Caenorhabditis nigoni TaxID=1611254 RepID=A0A2G5SXN8_9PELO|nr:hypothetical protein B9Z55_025183 [Caenorhabditis nigoni]